MRVLVTGGAGFIGSHLTEALVGQGHDVVVMDNLSTGRLENLKAVWPRITFIQGDIRELDLLREALKGVDLAYHEAAVASVQKSVEDPLGVHHINGVGTLNLLVAAAEAGCPRVVYASSAAVYGDDPVVPKVESLPPAPASLYGADKLFGEHLLRVFTGLHGLATVALRYFNVFGPRQDPSSPYSGVISRFCDRLALGQRPIIFGDGLQTRDFIYVEDVVRANLLAGRCALASGHAVINVGLGRETNLLDLLGAFGRSFPLKLEPELRPARPGDLRRSLADISEARGRLGFQPVRTIEEGLELTAHWYRTSQARQEVPS